MLSRAELELVADACIEHDLIAVTDEVYEHLVFDGEHVPLATLPGMAERTLTISSLGKTFSVTGWKIGWATGRPTLVAATREGQAVPHLRGRHAVPARRRRRLGLGDEVYAALATELRAKRDRLCAGSRRPASRAAARRHLLRQRRRRRDGMEFCRELPERAGVVAIPTSVFYDDAEAGRTLVRFAFCKREEVIDEAARRLAAARG